MPNANTPRGLMPVKFRDGSPYNGQANMYYVPASDATALMVGDLVKGVTNASDANGVPTVTRSAAGDKHIGVVVGIVTHNAKARLAHDPNYRQASVEAYVMVADDPSLLFEAQEDDVGGAMPIGAGGRNVELIVAAGNTANGTSGSMLDSSTLATTATLSLRVHRAVERADNVPGGGNLKWLVSINLHAFTTALGV